MADGACVGAADPDVFFPDDDGVTDVWAEARETCQSCDVIDQCLTWAIFEGIPHGMWGGMNPSERRRLLRSAMSTMG